MDGILRNPHISFPPGTDGDVIVENKHFCVMVTFHLNAWCAPVCASRAATPTFCLRRRQIFFKSNRQSNVKSSQFNEKTFPDDY